MTYSEHGTERLRTSSHDSEIARFQRWRHDVAIYLPGGACPLSHGRLRLTRAAGRAADHAQRDPHGETCEAFQAQGNHTSIQRQEPYGVAGGYPPQEAGVLGGEGADEPHLDLLQCTIPDSRALARRRPVHVVGRQRCLDERQRHLTQQPFEVVDCDVQVLYDDRENGHWRLGPSAFHVRKVFRQE